MGRRSQKAAAIATAGEPTETREALELRWRNRLTFEPRLATLVTAQGGRREPFHRWVPYKQGFSPGLVRQFLAENPRTAKEWAARPALDPFSGSGTCAAECAKHGVRAIGVEAITALVFLTKAKFEREFPALPDTGGASTWREIAERFESPVHRAALMLAVGRRHTTAGRADRGARPLEVVLAEVAATMRDDLIHPLARVNRIEVGDARRMTTIDDGAIGGILTSPPYLSRHDYAQITNPYETVHRYWYGVQECVEQVRTSPRGRAECQMMNGEDRNSGPSIFSIRHSTFLRAAEEASEWLVKIGQGKLAGVARGYFEDMTAVLHECRRVLTPGGVCWMVVGGARIKDVYVPADLIVADIAEGCGFRVEAIRVARDLVGAPRKFGRLGRVAPRESLIVMSRA